VDARTKSWHDDGGSGDHRIPTFDRVARNTIPIASGRFAYSVP
jgi:hypothetical protein